MEKLKLRNKHLYKLFLVYVKYLPIIALIAEIFYSILAYLELPSEYITFLFGNSYSYIIFLYVISYVFKFCYLYRITLFSLFSVNTIAWYDTSIGIPISDLQILRIYLVILLIGIIAFIKFKLKDHVTNNKENSLKIY